jgi:hypothetical protein
MITGFTQLFSAGDVIAFLLVLFYAGSRFKTPKTVRSQTSRIQFVLSAGAYMASCTGVFMLLTWGLHQNPKFIHMLAQFGGAGGADDPANDLQDKLADFDAALVAALMLTTLLPNFPVLRDIDSSILRFFHRMGSIPFGAQFWARQMEDQFVVPPDAAAAMTAYIHNNSELPESLIGELQADPTADLMRFRFTRNLAIYVALSNLKGWAQFSDEYPDDAAEFAKKIDGYFEQCVGFLALAAKLSPQQLGEVPESVQKFRLLNCNAYEELRLMLARVMLYSCNSETEIIARLARIGFALQRPRPITVPFNLLAMDMVALLVFFVLTMVISSRTGQIPIGKAIAIGLLVSVNHSIAAAFALLPKQWWSFADIRRAHERPYLGYIVSMLLALTISLPISYAFFLVRLQFASEIGPFLAFDAQCKWLLLSTTLAFALAFACDDASDANDEPEWLRWAEGAGIAALMGVAGLLVVQWLASDQAALHRDIPPPATWIPIALSASIGALFGSTVPHWYRVTAHRIAAARAAPSVDHSLLASLKTH